MLITLGIIGVVAALTIPGLMTTLNNIKLKSQFKEAYSLLSQAVKMYNSDEEVSPGRITYKQFMKYFNGVTDCGGTSEVEDDSQFCMVRQTSEGGTSHVTNRDKSYRNFAKNSSDISTFILDDGQFYLDNNMLIMFDQNYDNPFVSIDINGKGQKPNAWGQDVFTFELMQSEKIGGYELVPVGAPGTKYTNKDAYCSRTNKNNMNGIACAYYAMQQDDFFNNLP